MEDGERDWNDTGRKVSERKESEKEQVEIERKRRRNKKWKEIRGKVKWKKEGKTDRKKDIERKILKKKNRYMEICK